ncbi:MAG TPA: transglycosylase domain-containing protein [Acidimicrobiales bacterium]|nr:transglycosylase domain-containing protein [Acidimicrobiales bacterium]
MLGFTILCLMASGLTYLAHLPLPNPHPMPQASYVYSDNGRLLADYQTLDRTDVKLSEVPKIVIDAVTSTEDRHFFTEGALDPTSIVRALVSDLFGSGGLQGGSTITQQYVKQAYLTPQRTLSRKIKEAFLAIKLEHTESKNRILQNYLNTIYLGRQAYGIEAAARAYFGEDVQQLGLPEASLLAGLIREPNIADPSTHPAIARQNQADTLASMVRDGQITEAQAKAVERMPFRRYVKPVSDDNGAHIADIPGDEYYLDAVHSELVDAYGAHEVETGGLRVTTTLNPTMQREAYTASYGRGPNALNPANGDPSTALVSVNGQGDVKALIGGQDYNTSEVDLALGANGGGSGRQPGSTFKMFMLATLIKDGYSVQSQFKAPGKLVVPHGNANGTPWRVGNFEGEASSTKVSIVQATAQSLNTVYAQIVERLGAAGMDRTAEEMGISRSQLKGAFPSQVLGTADVSPLEMAAAYSTLADGGVYRSPVLITKVTTATGRVLPLPRQTVRTVMTPTQAALMDYVLQQVVLNGTGTAAGDLGTPVAGKTGTTQNSDDAWFIGYTPKLTTAVWMGYADAERPMTHFRGHSSIEGGIVPAEIWHDAMASFLQSYPSYKGPFPPTPSLGGKTLPPPTNVVIPTTTTTTTVPPTTVPAPTTTLPSTVPTSTPTTVPGATTTVPAATTTVPATTPPTSASSG